MGTIQGHFVIFRGLAQVTLVSFREQSIHTRGRNPSQDFGQCRGWIQLGTELMKYFSASEKNTGRLAPTARPLTVGFLPPSWVCGDVGRSGKGLAVLTQKATVAESPGRRSPSVDQLALAGRGRRRCAKEIQQWPVLDLGELAVNRGPAAWSQVHGPPWLVSIVWHS